MLLTRGVVARRGIESADYSWAPAQQIRIVDLRVHDRAEDCCKDRDVRFHYVKIKTAHFSYRFL